MFEKIVCLSFMEFLQRLPFKLVDIMWHSFLCCHLAFFVVTLFETKYNQTY